MRSQHSHGTFATAADLPEPPEFRADPSCLRQLREHGPLMFWRPGIGGTKEGLLCMLDSCANPGCGCREMTAHLVLVNDQLLGVNMPQGSDSFTTVWWPKGDRPPRVHAYARVAFDSGAVEADGSVDDDALLAWLRSEMDGEMRALLRRRWSSNKGGPRPQETQKVGRNAPCPCGSGRKHKHCCGAVSQVSPI